MTLLANKQVHYPPSAHWYRDGTSLTSAVIDSRESMRTVMNSNGAIMLKDYTIPFYLYQPSTNTKPTVQYVNFNSASTRIFSANKWHYHFPVMSLWHHIQIALGEAKLRPWFQITWRLFCLIIFYICKTNTSGQMLNKITCCLLTFPASTQCTSFSFNTVSFQTQPTLIKLIYLFIIYF